MFLKSQKSAFCLLGSILFPLLFLLSGNGYAQMIDQEKLTRGARAPVWTEELGEVPLDQYTPEEIKKMVRDYWTPERMKNATPADIIVSDDNFQKLMRTQGDWFEEEPFTPITLAAGRISGKASAPNGKVFYRNALTGVTYSCSGSAVNSISKRLVSTAAHCIHGGGLYGTWHQNWWFVPNYDDLYMPDGMFTAYFLRTISPWVLYGESGEGFDSDIAFVTTYDNFLNQRVVDAVGGHGLATGGEFYFNATLFGYPWGINDGVSQQTCSEETLIRWIGSYYFHSTDWCFFGGGASGGPWLSMYNSATGLGTLRSVSSWGIGSNANISGPYFNYNKIIPLYNFADADWTD